ncbi:MAG: hypothetical protein KDD04_10610, partial [Sinomicrobium sp.]|nr:hypothetical protein [Sinomicrobium sp.]
SLKNIIIPLSTIYDYADLLLNYFFVKSGLYPDAMGNTGEILTATQVCERLKKVFIRNNIKI